MILSISCRNSTEKLVDRDFVKKTLDKLRFSNDDILSAHVYFKLLAKKARSKRIIECHISVHLAGRKSIDIFRLASSEMLAFFDAMDQIRKCLSSVPRFNDSASDNAILL